MKRKPVALGKVTSATDMFEEVIKKGTLDEVLTEYGWTKIKKDWSPPVTVAQENIPVCIGG